MTGRPPHGTCGVELLEASPIQSPSYHRLQDRRLDEVDAEFMRGRFGRLGRLRATAIPSAPLLPSLCITLGAASAIPRRSRLAISARISRYMREISKTNLWRRRRLFIFHDQHLPSPLKVLKLNLLMQLTPPFGPL